MRGARYRAGWRLFFISERQATDVSYRLSDIISLPKVAEKLLSYPDIRDGETVGKV